MKLKITANHVEFYLRTRLKKDKIYQKICSKLPNYGVPTPTSIHRLIPRQKFPKEHLCTNLGNFIRNMMIRENTTLENALWYYSNLDISPSCTDYGAIARRWHRRYNRHLDRELNNISVDER